MKYSLVLFSFCEIRMSKENQKSFLIQTLIPPSWKKQPVVNAYYFRQALDNLYCAIRASWNWLISDPMADDEVEQPKLLKNYKYYCNEINNNRACFDNGSMSNYSYFTKNDFEEVPERSTKKRKASNASKSEPAPKKIKLSKKDSDLRTQDNKVKEKDPQDSAKKPAQQKITKAYKKKSPNKPNDDKSPSKLKTKIIIDDDDKPDTEAAKDVKVKRKKKQIVEEELSDKTTPTPPGRKNNLLKATPRKSSRSPSRGSASSEISFEEHEGTYRLFLDTARSFLIFIVRRWGRCRLEL